MCRIFPFHPSESDRTYLPLFAALRGRRIFLSARPPFLNTLGCGIARLRHGAKLRKKPFRASCYLSPLFFFSSHVSASFFPTKCGKGVTIVKEQNRYEVVPRIPLRQPRFPCISLRFYPPLYDGVDMPKPVRRTEGTAWSFGRRLLCYLLLLIVFVVSLVYRWRLLYTTVKKIGTDWRKFYLFVMSLYVPTSTFSWRPPWSEWEKIISVSVK